MRIAKGIVDLVELDEQLTYELKVEVSDDLKEEEDQKNVDGGHSPLKLNPVFNSQVFVSLKISPEGVTGSTQLNMRDFSLLRIMEKRL